MQTYNYEQNIVFTDELKVNVGPLWSFASLAFHTGGRIRQLTQEYLRGSQKDILWDLRNVEPKRMRMSALTAFLSLAWMVRNLTGRPQRVLVEWKPEVLGFWNDIDLFRISDDLDLFVWPEGIRGGFLSDRTNPNTKILLFAYRAPDAIDSKQLGDWKKSARQSLKDEFLKRCVSVFEERRKRPQIFTPTVRDSVAFTTAELVLNSLLHGRDFAFVGLQRTARGVTVAACDSGKGFKQSLNANYHLSGEVKVKRDIDAVLFGSLMNIYEVGLRSAIDEVVRSSGWVVIASGSAEISWSLSLYRNAISMLSETTVRSPVDMPKAEELIGQPVAHSIHPEERKMGFSRIISAGLPGSRVAFEIRLTQEE